ncbi:hypothetical protein SH2C18_08630 [Clostridium sediminicola]|uniref:nuclease-related domain-containing protein n=1 Tax=Clostridium sediminicola TaxID=3114879 RepID=UPI0031F1DF91
MATIKSKERSVHKKRNKLISDSIVVYLFSAFIPLLTFLKFQYIYIIQLAILTSIISIIQTNMFKIKILNVGIKGEKRVYKKLKKLNKEYLVYNDITLWDGQNGAQIDHLIMSKYGIINIETKNMTGEIIGNENDEYWIQKKFGRGSNIYSNKFKNPCLQAKEHERIIKSSLKFNGVRENLPIKSIVVFNEIQGGRINVNTRNVKVFKESELFNYINNQFGKKQIINDVLVDKIIEIFDKRIEGRK